MRCKDAKPGVWESGQGKILQQLRWQHPTSGVVNHSLEPWDSTVEPLGDLRKDFSRCHSLFVLVVYFKYYSALSRCIEVLYYKGLDVEARYGEPPSVLTLFDRVYVRENLTCEECYSSKKFAPVCSNCACDCAGINNIGASIPSVNIVELRGKHSLARATPVWKLNRGLVTALHTTSSDRQNLDGSRE